MEDLIRRLKILIQNLVTRVVVDRSEDAGTYQVLWGGDRVSSGLEHLETQGLHFRVPSDAGGVVVSAGGQRDGGVLLVAGGLVPNDSIGEGEGGLHYLGEWKVFLNAQKQVCLTAKAPTDAVARASLVDARFEAVEAAIAAIVDLLAGNPPTDPPGPPLWIPVPSDGGAALQTAAGSLSAPSGDSVASEKVLCE